MSSLDKLINDIVQWHYARNLIEGSTALNQFRKLEEEVDELYGSILEGGNPIDDIGDIIVVLINIAERYDLTIEQCLAHAYNDIKDRKGTMVDGLFVKETHL